MFKTRSNSVTFRSASSLPFSEYFVFALVGLTAVVMGLAIGQGQWKVGVAALFIPLVLLYPVQVALGVFALLIPFDSIVVLGAGEKGRTLTYFAGAAAAAVLVGTGLVSRRLRTPPVTGIWWVLFVCWCAMTMVWGLDTASSMKQFPSTIAILGLYLASGCFRYNEKEVKVVVFLTILGGCIAALWTVHLYYSGNFWTEGKEVSGRGSLIAGGRQNNPDLLAMTLILPISLACGYFFSYKRWINKALPLLVIGACTLGLLLTLSRGAVLSLVVVMFVFLYRLKIGRRIVAPVILLGILLTLMPSVFFTRFQEAGKNGGSGRTDIWKVGWVAFKHYGALGAGFSNFPYAYAKYAGEAPQYRGTYRDPHNIYVAVAVETGIVGLFLFAGAVRSQLRPAFRFKDRFGTHNLLPATEAAFWGLLVFGFSGHILWEKAFWLTMMLLTIAGNAAQDTTEGLTPQG